jgi:hypothetical protein
MKPFPALRGSIAIIAIMLAALPCKATPAAAPAVETVHRFETVGVLRLARCMNGKGGSAACYEAARQRGVNLGAALGCLGLALFVLCPLAASTRRRDRWKLQGRPRHAYPGGSRSLSGVQPAVQSGGHRAAQTSDDQRASLAAQMVA